MTQNGIREVLKNHPLVPVVNFKDLNDIERVCESLISKNIGCIEITLRSDVAMQAIAKTKEIYGEQLSIGVGTLVDVSQVRTVTALGVDFLVSPGSSVNLLNGMIASGIPFIPGIMTPSEIIQGMELGLDTFKLFPANIAGGIKALKAYGAVFPNVQFCPTGGISEDNYKEVLSMKNVICVGGSWLAK